MSNSPLVNYTLISPNKNSPRNHTIDTITIHCTAGQCTVESLGKMFYSPERMASSNYGIGYDGRIGMYVEEKDRSWCSGGYTTVNGEKVPIRVNGISGSDNDHRAITIEVASDNTYPYAVTDKAYNALIELVADICKRNNIKKLLWKGDKSLVGNIARQNMTVHRWFANKACPGDYLYTRHSAIASEVNKRLSTSSTPTTETSSKTIYRVQVGAFSAIKNAQSLETKLKALGFSTIIVKVGNLYKVQVGAFSIKSNAEATMNKLKSAGFSGFITTSSSNTSNTGVALKSVDEIAKEVIQGKWGSGNTRISKLKEAGYDPTEVQKRVNELLK